MLTTIRVDFLDRIERLPALQARYNERCKRYLLPAITAQGVREASAMPAPLAQTDMSEVVTAMLQEAADGSRALPLVENALLQLWEQRKDGNDGKLSGALFQARNGLAGRASSGVDALLDRSERAVITISGTDEHTRKDNRHTRKDNRPFFVIERRGRELERRQ